MSEFVVSARKYRPATFPDVVGQTTVTSTLTNAINSGQLAQAYLFCGPRGVGKTTCARILAREVNLSDDTATDDSFEFNIFELDAASNNSVEDIRSLIDQVRIPPQTGKFKVYIIDEVHMLSSQAFNAFLKTLEEPPPHAIFILATTEKHKILPTIISRCQVFDFNRIETTDMVAHLKNLAEKEGVEAEEEALYILAQKADGALRDALTLFDQMLAHSGGITLSSVLANLHVVDSETHFKMVNHFVDANIAQALLLFNETLNAGHDGLQFIIGLGDHLRNLLVSKDASTINLLDASDAMKERLATQSTEVSENFILACLDIIRETDIHYRASKNKRLSVEIALMKMASVVKTEAEPAEKKKHLILATLRTAQAQPIKIQPTSQPQKVETPPSEETPAVKTQETTPIQQTPLTEVEAPKTEQPETQPGYTPNKAVKELSTPAINVEMLRGESISINSWKKTPEQQEEAEAAEAAKEMNEHVTPEDFQKAWKELIANVLEEGRMSLHSTLSRREPTLNQDLTISLVIDNQAQQEELASISADIHEFLRNRLRNTRLLLETKITDKPEDKKAYTSAEKFEQMKNKYPDIQKLKDDLDLDIMP